MIALLLIASAPVFIILAYIYYRDKYEREPFKLLFEGLIAGGVIVFPAIYLEEVMQHFGASFSGLGGAAYTAFVVAAFVEEMLKFFAVYVLIWRNINFNESFDGIVYAVFVSLGFALVENVMYVVQLPDGLHVGITRAYTAVPAHAMFGVYMGYWFGLAKFNAKKRMKCLALALFFPFVFHGIYDFILLSQKKYLLFLFFPLLIFMLARALKRLNQHSGVTAFNPDSIPK